MKRSTVRHNKSAIIHEASRDKFKKTSLSRSPVKVVNGIKLFNFSDIDSYRMINKPYLNNQKSQMIKTKLNLQKSAWLITNQRIKRGNSFLKFNFNPFVQNKNIDKFVKDQEEMQPQLRNLVYQLNDMKNKNIDRKKHFAVLNNKKEQANKFSQYVRKTTVGKKHCKSMIDLPKASDASTSDKFIQKENQQEIPLDAIMKIEQRNAFQDQYKSINIFRILFHKEQYFPDQNKLDKYKFCFISMIQKNFSTKIPIYRDISRQARGCITKKPKIKMENTQQFSRVNIEFQDLINVSAGRYTSQYIFERLNSHDRFNSQQFVTVQDEDYKELIKNNKVTVTDSINQQMRQIEQYRMIQLYPFEKRYQKICQNRKQQISSNLKKEQYLANATIYDQKIHSQLRKEIQKNLKNFVQSDFKYPKTSMQRNKHVIETKYVKNRNEIVKMKKLLQTYFLKKENDQLINRLISNRK